MKRLESQAAAAPDDVGLRVKLILEYHLHRSVAEAQAASVPHVLWMIEHAPRHGTMGVPYMKPTRRLDPEAYEAARRLWLAHLEEHGDDIEILDHAIAFFLPEDSGTAEELIEQTLRLEPWRPRRVQQLERVRELRAWQSSPQAAAIRDAFSPYVAASGKDLVRYHRLPELADEALRAGQIEWAAAYAQELLQLAERLLPDWNYGNALHEGHRIRGHGALDRGDIARASEHLLAAGTTPGSPQLRSLGPDFSLAQALLAKGEREAVVRYLSLCSTFWPQGEPTLRTWIAAIEAGQTPGLDRFKVAAASRP